MQPQQGFIIDGAAPYNLLGSSLSGAGDFNGDGLNDLLLGARGAGSQSGEAYIVFGSKEIVPGSLNVTDLTAEQGLVLSGSLPDNQAGFAVTAIGDFNGDDLDDVAVSAPGADGGGSDAGESYIIFGSKDSQGGALILTDLPISAGLTLNAGVADSYVGEAIASAGDVNSDGFADLIIGAHLADPGNGDAAGQAYVVLGGSSRTANIDLSAMTPSEGFVVNGTSSDAIAGRSVGRAGDMNGDGIDDIAIGAPGTERGTGAAYVVFGRQDGFDTDVELAQLDGGHGFSILGQSGFDVTGSLVAPAGDVNGDGLDDLLVSAPNAKVGNQQVAGKTYVILGSEDEYPAFLTVGDQVDQIAFVLLGENAFDASGTSAASVGDINGDGLGDMIVGAPGLDVRGIDAGGAYIVFGQADF